MKIKIGELAWCVCDESRGTHYYLNAFFKQNRGGGWKWYDFTRSPDSLYIRVASLKSSVMKELYEN